MLSVQDDGVSSLLSSSVGSAVTSWDLPFQREDTAKAQLSRKRRTMESEDSACPRRWVLACNQACPFADFCTA
eukprot:3646201-Amphidinium_carterae.1